MTRRITEYLASGEADNLVLTGNIGYLAAQDSSYDGMFLRVENGITSLYKAKDQDIHWEDEDATSILLSDTPQEILSITITEDVLSTDGSFVIGGQVTNTHNKDVNLEIIVKDDGVQIATGTITTLKEESNKIFAFSGALEATIASGSVITVEFSGDRANVLTLDGNALATRIKVTKAQAAPVVMSIEEVEKFDWNQLQNGNPHIDGQLYIGNNNQVKVSQG